MNNKEYDQVLQECITLVLKDSEPIEGACRRFPKWGTKLQDDLRSALLLKRTGQSFEPRAGFIDSTRRLLVEQIANSGEQDTKSSHYLPGMRGFTARFAMALLIGLFLFLGVNGIVLAAEDSGPGDRLYGVRTLGENLQLILAIDPMTEVKLHQEIAQGHFVDCAALVFDDRYDDALVALRLYERHMAEAGRIIGKLPTSDTLVYNQLFTRFNQEYLQDLRVLQVLLPDLF